jgi:citrate lyase subunit beta / citryl-CoA lyase
LRPAAVAAGVMPIDTIYTDFKDEAGLRAECAAARRSGFVAKMAIHPAQVPAINDAFAASGEELAWARRIVALFAASPDAGTIALDGRMIDAGAKRAAPAAGNGASKAVAPHYILCPAMIK